MSVYHEAVLRFDPGTLQWTQVGSLILSTHYLHTIYTLSIHYLHTIYTLSTHYLHTIYTLSIHYILTIYTLSTPQTQPASSESQL